MLFAGEFQALPIGPADEKWDYVLLLKWPNIQEVHLLNTHSEYERLAAPHRRAAMEDMRIILATQYPMSA